MMNVCLSKNIVFDLIITIILSFGFSIVHKFLRKKDVPGVCTARLQLTKKQRITTSTFFNTSLFELQKPDFSQKKATKVKDHEAPRSQRSKKIWLGKFFLFDFSPNWTILSHLAKVFFSAFFGLLRPLKAIKAKKAKNLLNKCSKTD